MIEVLSAVCVLALFWIFAPVDAFVGSVIGAVLLGLGWVVYRLWRGPHGLRRLRHGVFHSFNSQKAVTIGWRPFCGHRIRTAFVRTDSTEGSGCYSDSYAGEACAECGLIISERKVH